MPLRILDGSVVYDLNLSKFYLNTGSLELIVRGVKENR